VYGMPSSVKEAGLAHAEAPLEDMAALIMHQL
jgi:chemotaxis response regulator CheB